jgi:hypothetical protein
MMRTWQQRQDSGTKELGTRMPGQGSSERTAGTEQSRQYSCRRQLKFAQTGQKKETVWQNMNRIAGTWHPGQDNLRQYSHDSTVWTGHLGQWTGQPEQSSSDRSAWRGRLEEVGLKRSAWRGQPGQVSLDTLCQHDGLPNYKWKLQ